MASEWLQMFFFVKWADKEKYKTYEEAWQNILEST